MKPIYFGRKDFNDGCYYNEYVIRFLGETLSFTAKEVSFIQVLQYWCDKKAGKSLHRTHKNKTKWYDKVWIKILSYIEFKYVRPLYQKEREKQNEIYKSRSNNR